MLTPSRSPAIARKSRAHAARTRSSILDAALRLFSKRGYAQTSIDDVARELGLTRGAVYGHFNSKPELYQEMMRFSQDPLYRLLAEMSDLQQPGLAAVRTFLVDWFKLLANDPRVRESTEVLLNKTALTDELSELLRRERRLTADLIAGLTAAFSRAADDNDWPANAPADDAGLDAYAFMMGLTQTWLFDPGLFDLKRTATDRVDRFLVGLVHTANLLPQTAEAAA